MCVIFCFISAVCGACAGYGFRGYIGRKKNAIGASIKTDVSKAASKL